MKKITRKQFFKTALFASGATMLPTWLSACGDDIEPVEGDKAKSPIIVIGAGFAGLAAATRLKDRGFTNVTILEARNRLGGRVFTDRSLGLPVDMGASWIHGPDGKNPITPIAKAANANMYLTDDESLVVYDVDGKKLTDTITEVYYMRYEKLLAKIRDSGTSQKSVLEVLSSLDAKAVKDTIMQYQFSAYMEFDTGGDIKDLSSKNFDNDEVFAGDDVLFPNGYDEVVNHLAKDLTIEKEVVVQSIDYAGSEVLVKTNKGEKKAKFVVCTLPLGVLKAGGVAFSPVLPAAITNAIRNIWVGNVNKVALLWDTAFWDENVQYVGYCSAEKGAYNYIMNVKKFLPNVNMLMTFGFGNYGKVIEKQTDTQVKDDVMIALRKIYGNSIPEPKKVLVSRWGKDEFALGSYSFFGVDMEDADFQAFEKPLENKLFFAGEHTNVEYRGTVHGAYLSGVRAADAI